MKKALAILLSLLLVLAAMPLAMSATAAEDDVAVITIDGVEYTTHVGDIIHYAYLIDMSKVEPIEGQTMIPGRVTEFEDYFYYSSDMLEIITPITEYDENLDDDIYPFLPVIKLGVMVGTTEKGVIKMNGAKNADVVKPTAGWNFAPEKPLIQIDLKVTKAGTGDITNDLHNLGSNVTKIVKQSVVQEAFKDTFVPKTTVTVESTYVEPETEAPTSEPETEAPTSAPETEAPTEEPSVGGFYIAGSMNGYAPNEAYKLTKNDAAGTDEYVFAGLNLTTTDQFKIAFSADGVVFQDADWYPTGMGNNYGENGEIAFDGVYDIYFRPQYDGAEDWFYSCIYADAQTEPETEAPTAEPETEPETEAPTAEPETEPETEAPTAEPETEAPTAEPETEAPTAEPETEPETDAPTEEPAVGAFYIAGTMNGYAPNEAYKLTKNEAADTDEYMFAGLNLTTTDQFKIAFSADGVKFDDADWYPTGMGNNYGQNGEIAYDGVYDIYFRPLYDGGEDWFNGCIYADAKTEPPTEAPETEPETEAPTTEPETEPETEAPTTAPETEPETEAPVYVKTDPATGVSVTSTADIDAELVVKKINHYTLDVVFPGAPNDDIYNVKLMKAGKEVVINGFLTVSFPAKDETAKLYAADAEWDVTALDGEFDKTEGTISYLTDSLGNFIVSSADNFTSRIRGDVDLDGDVTILDATMIQRWLVELEVLSDYQLLIADYDCDGEVTVLDATAIQRWLVELDYTRYNQD